ncbi:hypothetical protein B0T18DRAFT_394312 [Schizothecium vesticola]|uniref:Uncharacterized protein n=1 Tax=Schizothecium vesticola TaxID=314040 RepID=A0AA40BPB6_9PEZI|nr:hypothetical protein B0T18DRAFT_394312 [Schizothecium vesticola]
MFALAAVCLLGGVRSTPSGSAPFLTLVRMASLTIGICLKAFGPWIAGIILGSIIGVVSLHFVCLSLAFISQARGERRCMGIRWKRWHFDALLGFFVCAHCLHLFSEFLFFESGAAGAAATVWMLLGIMIVALGLIAARDPDGSRWGEELRIGM